MNLDKNDCRVGIIVFFLMLLTAACNSELTPPPAPDLPTFAPPVEASSTPTMDREMETRTPTVSQTLTQFDPEATASLLVVTATEWTPATIEPTILVSDSSSPCVVPNKEAGWSRYEAYIVQADDTLYSLAVRSNTSIDQIQRVNCLGGTIIYIGQPIYLPSIPVPIPTVPTPPTIVTPTAPAPGDPRLDVDPGNGAAGTVFTFIITEFLAGEEVTVSIKSRAGSDVVPPFTVTMDGQGNLDHSWTSPTDLLPGPYTVEPTGSDHRPGKGGGFLITPPTLTPSPTPSPTPSEEVLDLESGE